MTEQQPSLFELASQPRLRKGDFVTITTMWGEEVCLVTGVGTEDDWPMVQLQTPSGDEVSVSVARVHRTDA
jgi:hypothetical protein